MARNRIAVVAGDVTMDWGIAERTPPVEGAPWDPVARSTLFRQAGGAVLLRQLLEKVTPAAEPPWVVRGLPVPSQPHRPDPTSGPGPEPAYHQSFALWKRYPERRGSDAGRWRVARFLGNELHAPGGGDQAYERVVDDTTDADLLVLIDATLGFRHVPKAWPLAVMSPRIKRPPWVVLRLTYTGAAADWTASPLWSCLAERHPKRIVVVTSARDLRRSGAQISPRISWERTAEETVQQLLRNQALAELSGCARVVVTYGTAGGLVFSQCDREPRAKLLFDPGCQEGEWSTAYPGRVIGSTSVLTAAVARQVMCAADLEQGPSEAEWEAAVQSGVLGMRALQRAGYGDADAGGDLGFPLDEVARAVGNETAKPLAVLDMEPDLIRDLEPTALSRWTILERQHGTNQADLARKIVRDGIGHALGEDAAAGMAVPVARFAGLTTVDRFEIEALRSIRSLIGEYCERPSKPLSIAVFGAPGSGKSFGVEQVTFDYVASQPEKHAPVTKLDFNLSQFGGASELFEALHQVRDAGLSGHLPLVTWDEFDATLEGQELGWLRYFLAPMQDGRFQQGEITHPIGAAIFVFTGSTAERMVSFGRLRDGTVMPAAKSAKVDDFKSRLDGYMDVPGINPTDADSEAHVVRRAIILRSIILRDARQLVEEVREGGGTRNVVNIDDGVLRAFLETEGYQHGIRSMTSIVKSSRLAGESKYLVSSLPQEDQLRLHVGADFRQKAMETLFGGP